MRQPAFCPATNHLIMPKKSLPFLFCLLLSLTFAIVAPVHLAHADDLSQGLELYQAKKYRDAIPYLEKAAREGQEEAIRALDAIYADKTPAVAMSEKDASAKSKNAAPQAAPALAGNKTGSEKEAQSAPAYEKATVAEDPKKAEDRAFLRKVMFLGTAALILVMWIVQYFLLRKLRNQNFRKETPTDAAAKADKTKVRQ